MPPRRPPPPPLSPALGPDGRTPSPSGPSLCPAVNYAEHSPVFAAPHSPVEAISCCFAPPHQLDCASANRAEGQTASSAATATERIILDRFWVLEGRQAGGLGLVLLIARLVGSFTQTEEGSRRILCRNQTRSMPLNTEAQLRGLLSLGHLKKCSGKPESLEPSAGWYERPDSPSGGGRWYLRLTPVADRALSGYLGFNDGGHYL